MRIHSYPSNKYVSDTEESFELTPFPLKKVFFQQYFIKLFKADQTNYKIPVLLSFI